MPKMFVQSPFTLAGHRREPPEVDLNAFGRLRARTSSQNWEFSTTTTFIKKSSTTSCKYSPKVIFYSQIIPLLPIPIAESLAPQNGYAHKPVVAARAKFLPEWELDHHNTLLKKAQRQIVLLHPRHLTLTMVIKGRTAYKLRVTTAQLMGAQKTLTEFSRATT